MSDDENPFKGRTDEQLKRLLGTKIKGRCQKQFLSQQKAISKEEVSFEDLPINFDSREKWS